MDVGHSLLNHPLLEVRGYDDLCHIPAQEDITVMLYLNIYNVLRIFIYVTKSLGQISSPLHIESLEWCVPTWMKNGGDDTNLRVSGDSFDDGDDKGTNLATLQPALPYIPRPRYKLLWRWAIMVKDDPGERLRVISFALRWTFYDIGHFCDTLEEFHCEWFCA